MTGFDVLSVVIATHHDELGCYLTTFAARAQLGARSTPYELIVVADGGTPTKWESRGIRCLRVNTGSPQGTRDAGIRAARYDNVLVLDSHVVVNDIHWLLTEHRRLGGALTFCPRVGEGTELFNVYGHETDWDGNLWYKRLVYQPNGGVSPHRVVQFGHSCFIVDKAWYVGAGGYTDLLAGWGGEEHLLCLKAWLLGRECWMVRGVWFAHYLTAGAHVDTPHLAHNMLTAAYVLGGEQQLEKTRRQYNGARFTVTPEVEAERRRIVAGPFGGDLDRLRTYLREIGVASC